MAIVRYFNKIIAIIKKGFLVFKRDGLAGGLKRGYSVYRQSLKTGVGSSFNLSLLKIKGMHYEKKGSSFIFKPRPFPMVTIVIPVLNGLSYVRDCIESIYSSPVNCSYEVIAIDQNSVDGTKQYLKNCSTKFENFLLIENKTNVGFASAMNQGALIAKGQFLVLANSDLIFTPHWLNPLVDMVEREPQTAVVSPMTNYVGEGPQIDLDARDLKPEGAKGYAQKIQFRTAEVTVTDRLVFFCALIRTNVYHLLGGLANVYALGNYEDDDFCLRVRLAGFQLKIASNSFVYHLGSKTFKQQAIDYTKVMVNNEKIFFQRVVDFSQGSPLYLSLKAPVAAVSVIVRTKDRPYLLKQALLSLIHQTYRDFEVILINNGKASIQPVVDFCSPYLNLRVLNVEPGIGRSKALNEGLAASSGKWISYLDDDDLVYPTHLENLVSGFIGAPETKLVYTDANKSLCWVDSLQENIVAVARERFAQQDFDYEAILIDNWIPIMSYMHPAEDAQRLGGYDESLDVFEDWDFLLRLTKNGKVRRVPRITCEYRMRFGDAPDDSTLVNREKALKYRQEIYRRYPEPSEKVKNIRKVTFEIVDLQMDSIKKITAMPVSSLQKNYLLAASLGAFKSVDDTIQMVT